jgi:hypothetical protein
MSNIRAAARGTDSDPGRARLPVKTGLYAGHVGANSSSDDT